MIQRSTVLASALMASIALPAVAQAATIGHWRFEEGNFLGDSGPNGLALIQAGSPTAVSTPFTNPVPQTGQANNGAADLGSGQAGHFGYAETVANQINVTDFTIELYVRQHNVDFSIATYLAGEWTDQNTQRGWALGVGEGSGTRQQGELFLLLAPGASGAVIVESNLDLLIEPGKDYYVAAMFDESNQTNGVTFVIDNLTDGVSKTVSVGHSVADLYQPVTTFRIGTMNNAADRRFPGVIDEVRLSDTVLAADELLNVPEPATASLAFVLLATLTSRPSRREIG